MLFWWASGVFPGWAFVNVLCSSCACLLFAPSPVCLRYVPRDGIAGSQSMWSSRSGDNELFSRVVTPGQRKRLELFQTNCQFSHPCSHEFNRIKSKCRNLHLSLLIVVISLVQIHYSVLLNSPHILLLSSLIWATVPNFKKYLKFFKKILFLP